MLFRSISGPVPKGDDQLFEQLRPQVERLVEAQKKLATQYLADAKRLIASNDKKEVEEGFLALYRSHKALPKNKALIKFLSEQGIKAGMLKTEEIYMEQNNKRMHEVTDPLYFVIDEKLNSGAWVQTAGCTEKRTVNRHYHQAARNARISNW